MYQVIIKGILFCLLLSCHYANAENSPQRRWIKISHQTLKLSSGEPAFVMVLRGQEETCSRHEHKDGCFRMWSAQPDHLSSPGSDEAEYWDDYDFGPEYTRVNKESFCVMTDRKDQVLVPCDKRWEILLEQLHIEREEHKSTQAIATA